MRCLLPSQDQGPAIKAVTNTRRGRAPFAFASDLRAQEFSESVLACLRALNIHATFAPPRPSHRSPSMDANHRARTRTHAHAPQVVDANHTRMILSVGGGGDGGDDEEEEEEEDEEGEEEDGGSGGGGGGGGGPLLTVVRPPPFLATAATAAAAGAGARLAYTALERSPDRANLARR